MKLLASAAALLCALALVPTAAAARPADFELRAPDRATAKLSAPRAFNLVGLRWRGRALPDVELRVRRGRGWSRWQHVGVHGAGGSDPLWVGRARTVQYKLDRRVRGLRLHFVTVGKRRPRARASQAVETPFPYVTRAEWGAGQCVPRNSPGHGEVKAVTVHHTVSLNDYTAAEAPQIVLAICRYHRNSNGWSDIGYNALVDKFGTIYEGRAGGLDQAIVGAHAQGFNSTTAGIANIGDYSSVEAGQESLAATADYIRWKLGVHGQPLSGPVTIRSSGGSASRYPAGAYARLQRVNGHRDVGSTECPGDELYGQLDQIRALVESGSAFAPAFTARVSAWLGDSRVHYGTVVPVTGYLGGADGAPLGGQAVELQVNSENRWRTARRATADPAGSFATELKPRKRMYVRLRYPGSSDLRRAVSRRMLLRVHPVVDFVRPPRRARQWQRVRMRGTVAPRKRIVNVVLQQRVSGRWRKVGVRRVRARRGRFSASFVPGFRDRYRFYAVVKPDLDTDRGASELHTLRVR